MEGARNASSEEVSIKLTNSSGQSLTKRPTSKNDANKGSHHQCNATEDDMYNTMANARPLQRSPEKSVSYGFDPCFSPRAPSEKKSRRGSATSCLSASCKDGLPAKRAFAEKRFGSKRDGDSDDTSFEFDKRKKSKFGRLDRLLDISSFENQKHRQDPNDILCKLKDEGIIWKNSHNDLHQSPTPKHPMFLPPLQPISHGSHTRNISPFDWNGAPKVQQQLCHKMKMRQLELNAKCQQENHDQHLKMRHLMHSNSSHQSLPKPQSFNPSAREDRHDRRMAKLGLPIDGTRGREESLRERKEKRKRKKARKESAKRIDINVDIDDRNEHISRCSTRNDPTNLP